MSGTDPLKVGRYIGALYLLVMHMYPPPPPTSAWVFQCKPIILSALGAGRQGPRGSPTKQLKQRSGHTAAAAAVTIGCTSELYVHPTVYDNVCGNNPKKGAL